jgi:hypothetical protein
MSRGYDLNRNHQVHSYNESCKLNLEESQGIGDNFGGIIGYWRFNSRIGENERILAVCCAIGEDPHTFQQKSNGVKISDG